MKLHDLRPAPGSRRQRTRVGRGIAAGQGKTAGRGTKGQKARTGTSIPAWFEGGQTPIHIRVPKLRGFRNRGRVEFQVVNIGRIAAYAAAGRFGVQLESAAPAKGPAKGRAKAGAAEPVTVNAETLAQAGLVRHPDRPLKVLGAGEVELKLFVAADAISASARTKIEAAGGFVQVLAPEKPAKTEKTAKPEKAATGSEQAAEPSESEPAAESAEAGEPASDTAS